MASFMACWICNFVIPLVDNVHWRNQKEGIKMKWQSAKDYTYYLPRDRDQREQRLRLYEEFVNRFGFDKVADYTQPRSLRKLMEGKRSYNTGIAFDTDGFEQSLDHALVFKISKTNEVMLVSHPYGIVEESAKKLCEKAGLVYHIESTETSFYSPGHTDVILFMTPGNYDKFKSKLK